ncbi:15912_t:CDS:2 [Rhizophagus irregularis]|nr:15912_t:CDS:2 [Rhizophagus irregularis]
MSETQVIEQTNVTTTVQLKETFVEEKSEKLVGIDPERTTSKNETTTGLTHNEEVLTNDEQDHRYDDDNFVEGGNSEAVSISSSKLRASTVQFSNNNTNVISSSTQSRQIDSVASEYQDEDPSDETVSCICPFNNIVNWINSFYKKHKIKK